MSHHGGGWRSGHRPQRNTLNYNQYSNQSSRESQTAQVRERDTRPARETDKWPSKEHEKFCELMMPHWTQACSISLPYRRTAQDVFSEVASSMTKFGFNRDEEDCYLYWHHVGQKESYLKNTLSYPEPPARTNGKLSHMVEVDPSHRPDSRVNDAPFSDNTPRTGAPRTYVDLKAVAKKAVELMYTKAYILNPKCRGGGSLLMNIPDELVPLVIGPAGVTVNGIEQSIGCKISCAPRDKSVNHLRPVTIYGSREAALQARDRVAAILSSKYEEEVSTDDKVHPEEKDFIMVPEKILKRFSGPNNDTMSHLLRKSGCKTINIRARDDNGLRYMNLSGSLSEIAHAKRLITEIIEADNHGNIQQTTASNQASSITTGFKHRTARTLKASEQDSKSQSANISNHRQNVKSSGNNTTADNSFKSNATYTTSQDISSCVLSQQSREALSTTNSELVAPVQSQKLVSTDSMRSTDQVNVVPTKSQNATPVKTTNHPDREVFAAKQGNTTGYTKSFRPVDHKNDRPIQSKKTTSTNSTQLLNSKMTTSDQCKTTSSTKTSCPLDPAAAALIPGKSAVSTNSTRASLDIVTPSQSKATAPMKSNQSSNVRMVTASQSNNAASKVTNPQPLPPTSNPPQSASSDSDDCTIISLQPSSISQRPSTPKRSAQQACPSNGAIPLPVQDGPRPRTDNPPISRPRPVDPNDWSAREIRVLHEAVDSRRQDEFSKHRSVAKLAINDDQFWVYMSRRVNEAGFNRSAEACRTEWEKSFHSPYGLIIQKLDEPDEEQHEANRYVAAETGPGATIAGYNKPVNGLWTTQEKWDVDDLMKKYKNVSFTEEGPREHMSANSLVTWEGITQLHNKAGYSRSIPSLMKMWNDVRSRKAPLPPIIKNRVTKRLLPSDNDNGEGSSKRPRHLPPGNGSFSREDFDVKLRNLQHKITDVEKKEAASEKKVDKSKEKLAQLELERQTVLSEMNKDVEEGAALTAEKDKLKEQMVAVETTMHMFFN